MIKKLFSKFLLAAMLMLVSTVIGISQTAGSAAPTTPPVAQQIAQPSTQEVKAVMHRKGEVKKPSTTTLETKKLKSVSKQSVAPNTAKTDNQGQIDERTKMRIEQIQKEKLQEAERNKVNADLKIKIRP